MEGRKRDSLGGPCVGDTSPAATAGVLWRGLAMGAPAVGIQEVGPFVGFPAWQVPLPRGRCWRSASGCGWLS